MSAKRLKKVKLVSSEELKDLARLWHRGHLVTDQDLTEAEIPTVFMVVGLGGLNDIDPDTVGLICEDRRKAGPMAANNKPIFFSCRLVAKEQMDELIGYIEKLEEMDKTL